MHLASYLSASPLQKIGFIKAGAWFNSLLYAEKAQFFIEWMIHYSFCSLNRNYLVTLPAQLNFPSTQKICLDLSPGYYDIKFTITLETRDKTQKLLEHRGLKKRHLHCISFLVSTDVAPLKFLIFLLSSLGIHCNRTLSMFSVILLL